MLSLLRCACLPGRHAATCALQHVSQLEGLLPSPRNLQDMALIQLDNAREPKWRRVIMRVRAPRSCQCLV